MNGLTLKSKATLRDGNQIPRLGLGVWQCPMVTAKRAVLAAMRMSQARASSSPPPMA